MMTTLSAGAAAGLLVALMVVATNDVRGAELMASAKPGTGNLLPGNFAPQPASADAARLVAGR